MKFAVLYSEKDPAGTNIVKQLKYLLPQVPIINLKKETIYAENIDKLPFLKNAEFIVFASKHSSKESRSTLSLHAPGNWRNAELGGSSGKVCRTSALVLKYLFQELNKNTENSELDYEVTLEVTHHGPYVEKPCCFIEIGSGEEQWQDEQAAKIIAKTISSLQNYNNRKKYRVAIGVGNGHYCPNFNKIQLNSEYAISHIIPQYSFPVTHAILREAIEKTEENVSCIILDWKGCQSKERQEIINLAKKLSLEYKRTSEIEK